MKKLNPFTLYTGLPNSIYILFIARVINAFGSFVMPFLGLYMTVKLGQNEAVAGFWVTVASLTSIPGSFYGGKLADHIGRKKVLVFSQFLSGALLMSVVVMPTPILKILMILLTGTVIGASYPAMDALIADLTNTQQRKPAFSLLYLGLNIGYALGPLTAGLLFKEYTNLLFLGDGMTTLISAALLYLWVQDAETQQDETETKAEETKENEFSVLVRMPVLLTFILLAISYTFSYGQYNFTLPLYLNEVLGSHGSNWYGVLMTINSICVLLCTSFVTQLTKNSKSIWNMVLSGLFYGIGFGMYFFATQGVFLILCTILWTFGEILISTNFTVYISEHSPVTHRARILALAYIISKLGMFLSPLIAGLLIKQWSASVIWIVVAVIMTIATLGMCFLYLLDLKTTTTEVKGEQL